MRWVIGILGVLLALLLAGYLWMQPAQIPSDTGLPGDGQPGSESAGPLEDAPGLSSREGAAPATADAEARPSFEDAGGIQLVGKAVDETRRPVAGARVFAQMEGTPTGQAVTGPDGRLSVSLGSTGPYARFGVLRIQNETHGLDMRIYLSVDAQEEIDFGTLVLRTTRPVDVHVTKAGSPVAGADVALRSLDSRGGGTLLQQTDAEGRVRFDGVSAEKVAVFAVAEGSGRTHAEVVLEAQKGPVEIELAADRAITVRVVRGDTEEPVAGAEIVVWGELSYAPPQGEGALPPLGDIRTDDAGVATVAGLHKGWLGVLAKAPGLAMRNNGSRVERVGIKPEESEATVTLWPYRTVRFPVAEGSPKPADETELKVRRYQPISGYDVGEPRGLMADGMVVLENFPPGFDWGHVEAPDGTWAEWKTPLDKDLGEPVRFQKIYDLKVQLTWPDGSPAVGQMLWANLQPRGRSPHIASDEHGIVVFEHCVAQGCHVMWSPTEDGFGMSLGTVPLQSDPGTVTYEVQPIVEIEVAVSVEGKPGLPAEYTLSVEDRGPRARAGNPRQVSSTSFEEDAERGIVRFSWPRKEDGSLPEVFLRAPGYTQVSKVPEATGKAAARVALDLAGSTKLKLVVLRPEHGRYYAQLERWEEDQGDWYTPMRDAAMRTGARGVQGVHRYEGLAPGRYRVREFYTGLMSAPFELAADGTEVEIEFDVRASRVVKGRVTVPAGESVAFASVRVEGRERIRGSQMNPIRVQEDGTFELRALEGEKLGLLVDHPLLGLAAPGTHVVGSGSPTLALVARPVVQFRIAGMEEMTTTANAPNASPAYSSPIRVRMGPAAASNEEKRAGFAIATDGVFRIAREGDTSVPWRIEILQHQRAPLVLEDVAVRGAVTDLGTLTLSEGATLTAKLIKGKEAVPQWVAVRARPVGAKSTVASSFKVEPTDPPEVRLKGLAAGRFVITVQKMMSKDAPILETEVESDGKSPIVIEVKLP